MHVDVDVRTCSEDHVSHTQNERREGNAKGKRAKGQRATWATIAKGQRTTWATIAKGQRATWATWATIAKGQRATWATIAKGADRIVVRWCWCSAWWFVRVVRAVGDYRRRTGSFSAA